MLDGTLLQCTGQPELWPLREFETFQGTRRTWVTSNEPYRKNKNQDDNFRGQKSYYKFSTTPCTIFISLSVAEPLQTLVSTLTTVNRRIKLSSQINSLIFHNEFSRLFWHVTDAGVDCPSSARVWYVRAMIKNHSIQIDRSGTHIKHVADTGAQIKQWGCKNFHIVWNTLQLSRIWKCQSCR